MTIIDLEFDTNAAGRAPLGDIARSLVSVDELLRGYDGTTPLNVGYLVPRGNLRLEIMGLDERAPKESVCHADQFCI